MGKFLSEEVYKKLKEELERLKKIERKVIAEKIKTAKEFGDLSENTEYQTALEEQKKLEKRIFELEDLLKNAKIIKRKISKKKSKIDIGAEVILLDLESKKKIKYQIVGFGEANPFENKISPESTLGKALFGKEEGAIVEIELSGKKKKFKIQKIL